MPVVGWGHGSAWASELNTRDPLEGKEPGVMVCARNASSAAAKREGALGLASQPG